MNLVLHLFRTDVWHFRWRIAILWLVFAAHAFVANAPMSPHSVFGIEIFLLLFQVLFSGFLIAALMHADPFVGTNAAWMTRPTRRRHVFLAKTLFLIAILIAPKLLLEVGGRASRGNSGWVLFLAFAEAGMWTVGFVAVIAALASFTRSTWQFVLALMGAVVLMAAWTIAVDVLRRAGLVDRAGTIWWATESGEASRTTMAVLVCLAAALAAWLTHGLWRKARLAAVCFAGGLLAFPVLIIAWKSNFLQPRLTPVVGPRAILVETNLPSGAQPVAQEVAVIGLRSDEVAVIQEVSAVIQFTDGFTSRRSGWLRAPARFLPIDSGSAHPYFECIQQQFPSDTLWLGNSPGAPPSAFLRSETSERYGASPPSANISGSLEVDLFSTEKTANLPFQAGTHVIDSSQRVRIESVCMQLGEIKVEMAEVMARPMFDRSASQILARQRYFDAGRGVRNTYVLYHPVYREALIASTRDEMHSLQGVLSSEEAIRFSVGFPYSKLRERLTGVSAEEWLKTARLVVFSPIYRGTANIPLKTTLYTWKSSPQEREADATGLAAIHAAQISTNPTSAEVAAYLDTIFTNAPTFASEEAVELIRTKLRLLGPDAVPLMLERLPVPSHLMWRCVIPFLKERLGREHLPALLRGLERNLLLVRAVPDRSWEPDLRPAIIEVLRERRVPVEPDALRIVAEARDPATYPLLHWHFVHLETGRVDVIPALRRCPGFDFAQAVREAWERARVGVGNDPELMIEAARLQLPNAFVEAVKSIESAPEGGINEAHLEAVAALAGYEGPITNAIRWLSANLDRVAREANR